MKFCSKMDSNWSIAISFWYLWTWKFCFWSRIYPRQLVMTKKCPKSRLGGKKCQICATLAKSPYVLVSLLYKNYLLYFTVISAQRTESSFFVFFLRILNFLQISLVNTSKIQRTLIIMKNMIFFKKPYCVFNA